MARLSKIRPEVCKDSRATTPDSRCGFSSNEGRSDEDSASSAHGYTRNQKHDSESVLRELEAANILPTDTELDQERRDSAISSASISSLPESSFETDHDNSVRHYSSQVIRPSIRRSQIGSTFERNLWRSPLSSRSRTGTPKSFRVNGQGSPTIRKRNEEEAGHMQKKEYPLVLLHITILPVAHQWSDESMRIILPSDTMQHIQLLRSKASDIILQRGVLISHPKEDYELLEERLLEALELRRERITACGHFRARSSTSSVASTQESLESGDSGMGSSVEELCTTCHNTVKSAEFGTSMGHQKWSVKVYAANGLIRASAWAACWQEMERVDVEILPSIGEDARRRLDEQTAHNSAEAQARIRTVIEEQVRLFYEKERYSREESKYDDSNQVRDSSTLPVSAEDKVTHAQTMTDSSSDMSHDLPQVFRKRDIPVSLLLKNYLFLLLQDSRNIIILGLAAFTLLTVFRAALFASSFELSAFPTHKPKDSTSDVLLCGLSNKPETQSIQTFTSLDTASQTEVIDILKGDLNRPYRHGTDKMSNIGHVDDDTANHPSISDTATDQDAYDARPTIFVESPHIATENVALPSDAAQCKNEMRPEAIFGESRDPTGMNDRSAMETKA